MSVIVLLIVAGGLVAGGFLVAFVWAVRSGQFDDTFTPAVRVLLESGNRDAGSGMRDPELRMTNDEQRSPKRTAKPQTNSEAPNEQRRRQRTAKTPTNSEDSKP